MSNQVFPTNLPGLDPQIIRSEEYATKVLSGGWWSTNEERTRGLTTPIYRYTISFNCLRANKQAPAPNAAKTETELVLGFLRDHYGSWDSFLFTDPYDSVQRRVRLVKDSLEMQLDDGLKWYVLKKLELRTVPA